MSELYCCGQPVEQKLSKDRTLYRVRCANCGITVVQDTQERALEAFKKAAHEKHEVNAVTQAPPPAIVEEKLPVALPAGPGLLPKYMASRMGELATIAVPFIGREKPALTRLVQNNVRHILTRSQEKNFAAVWQSREGQESIVHAMEEALALGAELGKMGSVVPFGSVVEFVPAVEAYNFALTNGSNPPFKWIQIDAIYEKDIHKIERINGVFSCSITPSLPRGPIMAIAVYGHNNSQGHIIGEVYEVERLLGKAAQHSSSYKAFLRDQSAFKQAVTEGHTGEIGGRQYADVQVASASAGKYHEQNLANFQTAEKAGKLKTDSRGEYAEVKLPKKDSKETWTKKIYRREVEGDGIEMKRLFLDEITNPYDGPDRPEMLRKSAGKSFLAGWVKVRGAEAAMQEMQGSNPDSVETTIDGSFDAAFEAVETDGEKPDAENVTQTEATTTAPDGTTEEWDAMKKGKPLPKGEQGELKI